MRQGRANKILYFGILLFVLIEYIRPDKYMPLMRVVHFGTVLPLSLFVLSLLASKNITNSEVFKNNNTRWLMCLLFLITISIFTADVTFYAFTSFKGALGYFILFVLILKEINTLKKMKMFIYSMIIAHVVVIIISPDILLHPEMRSYLSQGVFLGDGNDFALSLNVIIPLIVFLYMTVKTIAKKMIIMMVLTLTCLAVIGTQSRGGTIALVAVIIYLWIKSRKKILGVILIIILVGIVYIFAPPQYYQRMESIKDYKTESSAQGRIMAWKSAIRMASAHPLIGVGAGHFAVKFGTEFRPLGYPERGGLKWLNAHSTYFLALGELGLPGIFFLLSIIISNLWSNEKKIKELKKYCTETAVIHQRLNICLNTSLIGFAVGGAFLSALYYPHLYVITGLITSSNYLYKKAFMDKHINN